MSRSPERWTRASLAAVGLLVAVVAVSAAAIAWPLQRIFDLREVIATQRGTLVALARPDRAQRPAAAVDLQAVLVAPAVARAGADLQARLVDLAQRHGVQLRATQILPLPADRDLQAVGVELTIEGDTAQTSRYLYALESGSPVILIDDVTQQLARPVPAQDGPTLATMLKLRAFVDLKGAP